MEASKASVGLFLGARATRLESRALERLLGGAECLAASRQTRSACTRNKTKILALRNRPSKLKNTCYFALLLASSSFPR